MARYDKIFEYESNLNGKGLKVGIVMSRFNIDVCEGLLSACTAGLLKHGVAAEDIRIATVAGALHESEYTQKLQAAGFTDVSIEPTRVYSAEDAKGLMQASGTRLDEALLADIDGKFYSGFIRARKPKPLPTI